MPPWQACTDKQDDTACRKEVAIILYYINTGSESDIYIDLKIAMTAMVNCLEDISESVTVIHNLAGEKVCVLFVQSLLKFMVTI